MFRRKPKLKKILGLRVKFYGGWLFLPVFAAFFLFHPPLIVVYESGHLTITPVYFVSVKFIICPQLFPSDAAFTSLLILC